MPAFADMATLDGLASGGEPRRLGARVRGSRRRPSSSERCCAGASSWTRRSGPPGRSRSGDRPVARPRGRRGPARARAQRGGLRASALARADRPRCSCRCARGADARGARVRGVRAGSGLHRGGSAICRSARGTDRAGAGQRRPLGDRQRARAAARGDAREPCRGGAGAGTPAGRSCSQIRRPPGCSASSRWRT